MKEQRIEKVREIMEQSGVDACAIRGMDNIFYLTGFRGSEGMLVITRGDVLLLIDFRYLTHARETVTNAQIVEMRQRQKTLLDICQRYEIHRLGFDSYHMDYNIYKAWEDMLGDIELIAIDYPIEEIRKNKGPDEITAITKAIDIATAAFNEMLGTIKPGRTEKEIANELDYTMRKLGADGPSFQTIVVSGARSALPHGEPSDKKIAEGEPIIIDFGAQIDGYCSDETCTICIGTPDEKITEIGEIVHGALKLGLAALKADLPIRTLDSLVREYIDDKGYGEYFRHGVGHGVGIAVHEAPAINSVSEGFFEDNMVVTIEPGIYLPGVGGVRLEDIALINGEKAEVISRIRKGIISI